MMRFLGRVLGTSALAVSMVLLAAPFAFAGEGDYNNDGVVDDADKAVILAAVSSAAGDAHFVPEADHNGDGVISLLDVSLFAEIYRAAQ